MKPALSDFLTLISVSFMCNVPKGLIIRRDLEGVCELWANGNFLEMKMVHKVIPIKNINVIGDFSFVLCTLIAQVMFNNYIFRLSINTGNWLAQSWGTSWA